jgi:hypothetical protein
MEQISNQHKIDVKQIDLAYELIQGISRLSYEYIYSQFISPN